MFSIIMPSFDIILFQDLIYEDLQHLSLKLFLVLFLNNSRRQKITKTIDDDNVWVKKTRQIAVVIYYSICLFFLTQTLYVQIFIDPEITQCQMVA